ncbi:MAG: DUF1003 domain-containing protein [Chloroflexi bacterium]|nr:MAG: DUF1003 domain-containing protein [Chloroflexota bacterium]TMG69712.1 MAG: DUF1003 domain-containing protein [Chloroflexota bacterium]
MRMTQMANHFRFHRPHLHLHSPFGDDWFGRRAESFARFFGTPRYLLMQTVLVLCWIALNAMGTLRSDPYPFILLNLLFSTQAAYAAPLILLAQTRQADREKAHAEADARHREEIAKAQLELLAQNTDITEQVARLAAQIEMLTREIHGKLVQDQRA